MHNVARDQLTPVRLLLVAGARPNFMKVAPVLAALDRAGRATSAAEGCGKPIFVHTGQHYDQRLTDVFFGQLGLPRPDYELGVGSGSHAAQTARVLERLEPVMQREQPDLVVVAGDVNSTLAAALCAAKVHIPVAHIEAGLRSHDRTMPEEINRIVTDQLSDLLFVTERSALANLEREGIRGDAVHFVGNTMIDTLLRMLRVARRGTVLHDLGLEDRGYGVVTLHRPSNVDEAPQLEALLTELQHVSRRLPLVWPIHPRTRPRLQRLERHAARSLSRHASALMLMEPLGYLEFVQLLDGARLVLTDSGGVQEETTVLGVPCLTLRTTTERPVTVLEGTNRLVHPDRPGAVAEAVAEILDAPMPKPVRPELWDGHAAERIVAVIAEWTAENAGGS